MAIPQEVIQEIHDKADIVEVIEDFLPLKKKGQNYWALSPFNNEKTPSFSVSPAKQIFKDFSSGKAGNAITFVMEVENYTYPEALRYLAKKYNIKIKEDREYSPEERQVQQEKDSIFIIHDFAKEYYKKLLHQSEAGQTIGLSYFKERGFLPPIIEKFDLGFSLPDWSAFTKEAQKKGYTLDILEKSGLSLKSEKSGQYFDRFRGRVIFPIHNTVGKVIAFGARILTSDKKQAKYLNSPETPIYHKSRVLYGIYQAKKAIRNLDNCYLVEGYTDVIALHQAGIKNVVASSGTSLTVEQIRLIKRYTPNVTVLYDGDSAGIKAALRGIDLVLEQGLNVRVVIFPESEDPDSYVRSIGSTAFQAYLEEKSQDFITFKAKLYQEEAQGNPIKRAEMIREVVESIARIPDQIKKQVYFQECSQVLEIPESVLIDEANKILKQNPSSRSVPKEKTQALEEKENASSSTVDTFKTSTLQERESIRLLLNYGRTLLRDERTFGDILLEELSEVQFEHKVYAQFLGEFRAAFVQGEVLEDKYFTQSQDPTIQQTAINLLTERYQISKNWKEKYLMETPKESEQLEKVLFENVLRLKLYQVQNMQKENEENLKKATEVEEQDKFLHIGLQLENYRKDLAQGLNNVILK